MADTEEGASLEQQRQAQQSDHELKLRIACGLDVEQFMRTAGGKALQAIAQLEIDSFLNELKDADATDVVAMQRIQNQIHRRELALSWLGELATAGEQAQRQFVDGEQ